MPSILQEWVTKLPLRHQGVLVSAIRGCDIEAKDGPSKPVTRSLRAEILVPATQNPTSYIDFVDGLELQRRLQAFVNDFDHYPTHFVLHLMHAACIVGYHSPTNAQEWLVFYMGICKKMHLHPESKEDLDRRLDADEKTFDAQQRVILESMLERPSPE